MKTILLALMTLLVTSVAYGDDKQSRYDDFVFTPNYETGSNDIKDTLEQSLTEFHYIEKLSNVVVDGNALALYRVKVKKDRAEEFAARVAHKEIVLKQKRDESDWTTWDAVSHVGSSVEMKTILKSTKYDDFFPVKGRRDYDYYGCIDSKPVYAARLIEGQPDFFFVITATQGSPVDPLVSDYMTLSISSSQGHIQLTEKIFWANFYPTKEGHKVHFYGESSPNLKFSELPIEDGCGRKRYAKMYITDLDQDNQLDILFWFKTFKSTEYSEKKGFRFEKESFKLYRENTARNYFEEKTIYYTKALELLQVNELTWENGYPQDNSLCEGWHSQVPMMMQIVD